MTLLVTALTSWAQQTEIYHWHSDGGRVEQSGGNIVQHNATIVPRINNECSGYYVITLLGKAQAIAVEDNSEDAQYMQIRLANGNVFRSGDVITITGMRNTQDASANATLYMEYGNGTVQRDENVWNNLGKLKEVSVTGGTTVGAKGSHVACTMSLTDISTSPSTYSFVVPDDAEGSTTLKLTRNICGCRLYLSAISITRISTGVDAVTTTDVIPLRKVLNNRGNIEVGKYDISGKIVTTK